MLFSDFLTTKNYIEALLQPSMHVNPQEQISPGPTCAALDLSGGYARMLKNKCNVMMWVLIACVFRIFRNAYF